MWIALQLVGLQCAIAALALGLARARARPGDWPQARALPARGWLDGGGWIALGWAAQTASLAAALGEARALGVIAAAWLAAGGGLLWFFWFGSWLRLRAMRAHAIAPALREAAAPPPDAGPEAGLPWLPWKILLLLGYAAWLPFAATVLATALIPAIPQNRPEGYLRLEPWCGGLSIGLAIFEGAALLTIVLYWLRQLSRLPADSQLGEAGLRPSLIGMTVLTFILFRIMAIALSLWLGASFDPLGPYLYLRFLMRSGGGDLLFMRCVLGLILPGTMALTLIADTDRVQVHATRLQLVPMLLLIVLGEFLGCAMIVAAGGLAF